MKKSIFLVFLLIFSISFLAACSKSQEQNNREGNGFRRPDFGQPERQADISGLVKSITGNEVTILKVERPQMQNSDQGKEGDENKSAQLSLGTGSSGRMPGMKGGGTRDRNMDEDMQVQMLERMKEVSTGEETVMIPVGIQMLKMERNNKEKEPEAFEATLSDIKTDAMINVWLDENVAERNLASFVLINN